MDTSEDTESLIEIPLEDDNGWIPDREKYCKQLANARGAFVWLHSKSAQYYRFWNKALILIATISTGIFGAIITIVDAVPNFRDDWKVIISFACITLIAGTFGAILQAVGLDTKSDNHSTTSGKSTTLFIRISKETQKPYHKRVPAITFIHSII